MQVDHFWENISPLILEQTPNVISLGGRCSRMGYTFRWEAYEKNPVLINPHGDEVPLEVIDDIPYYRDRANLSVQERFRGNFSAASPVTGHRSGRAAHPRSNTVPKRTPVPCTLLITAPANSRHSDEEGDAEDGGIDLENMIGPAPAETEAGADTVEAQAIAEASGDFEDIKRPKGKTKPAFIS